MRIEKYGAGGEKLSQAQLKLFELEPVVSERIEQTASAHAPVHRSAKKSGKHPGRRELPELSTNLAENSMRPVALGRKNWLHIGRPQAGPKVAAILSVA